MPPKKEKASVKPADLPDERRAEINAIYIEEPTMSAEARKERFAREFGENLDTAAGKVELHKYNSYWGEYNTRYFGDSFVASARAERWIAAPRWGDEKYIIMAILHQYFTRETSKKLSKQIFQQWAEDDEHGDARKCDSYHRKRLKDAVYEALEEELEEEDVAPMTNKVMKCLDFYFRD